MITQEAGLDAVEYFHLVFDKHEVVYAEGTAVESLLINDPERSLAAFAQYDGAIAGPMAPYAPLLGYFGGRQDVVALARLAVYPWVDVRDRIQIVYDRLAKRAQAMQVTATGSDMAA